MSVTYRIPEASDAAALSELGRTTFVDTFAHLYSPENLSLFLKETYSEAQVAAEIINPLRRIYVAEKNSQMVGYCKLSLEISLADAAAEWQDGIEIKQLYVLSSQFGAGTSTALMNWALDQAVHLNAPSMILSVWTENYRAQRFYQRFGFAAIGETYFQVGDHRDDELIFGLKLANRNQ
jgi:diamine N-acetyltransferase